MLRFDKVTCLSLLHNSILSERLINSLWKMDVLLYLEFINIVSILCYTFIEFIILLYTFSVIYFAQFKEYVVWRISFCKFSDLLLGFICNSAIGNLWSIYLGINILRLEQSDTSSTLTDILGWPESLAGFNGNISLLEALRITSLSSKGAFRL